MIKSRSSTKKSIAMEHRLSTNSESSSIDTVDIGGGRGERRFSDGAKASESMATLKTSDNNESEETFESDERPERNDHDDADADIEDDEMNNSEHSETNTHGTIVRRENLRQLENSMISMRKSFRFAANNNERMPNNNNNNNKNHNNNSKTNNKSKRAQQRIGSNENSDGNENAKTSQYSCPICGVCSATQHEFTEHIRGHNNSDGSHNYTCQICFKVVSSASSLDRHVLVHTGERPFTCKYCHVTFTTNGNMHRHMRTHKHRDGLTNKGAASVSNNPIFGSSAIKRGEQYESDGSTDSSASSSYKNYELVEGKRKNVDDDYSTVCLKRRLKTINNNNNIINNNSISTNSNAQPQRFCCPVCVRNDFLTMLSLETHVDTEHPSIQAKCRCCEIVFKSYKALNAHKCAAGNKAPHITQGFKDLTFVDFSSEKFPLIAKMMCEQSIRTPITNQKFECPKCYRAFPCLSAVEIHAKNCGLTESMHSISLRKRALSETSDDDNRRRDNFFAHLDLKTKNIHSNHRLAADSLPSTEYNSEAEIDLKKTHIKEEWNSPKMPHNEYKDLADIQSIINVSSSGSELLRQLDQPIASTASSSDQLYSRDDEEVQDAFTAEFRKMKLRGEFPCKLCTAIFPNLRALKGHNRIHLSAAGPGPFRCNMCPYSIHDKAALIRHMRTHNGDRPYECAICNYAFTTKANCERHLRNRHGKTTREDVKRAIIYHPSEDSSCDDPVKKMQIFNLSFEEDEPQPKDRSTPVLPAAKEAACVEKVAKIQVKSIDQLTQYQNKSSDFVDKEIKPPNSTVTISTESKPMDLSMDALDLSKKTSVNTLAEPTDLSLFEKNQQMLLAQQKLLSETLPQIDPAHYFQLSQLYRNLVFPTTGLPLHPFFLQNQLLAQLPAPNLNELKNLMKNDVLSTPPANMYPSGMFINPIFPTPPNMPQPDYTSSKQLQDALKQESPSHRSATPSLVPMPLTPQTPRSSRTPQQHHKLQHPPQTPSISPGPVKMVIKNGVLMPKQKQRRYRTERPFACEHCSARFTLRSNMERHIKQQHPQYWAQRQRSGHNFIRRGSSNSLSASTSTIQNQSADLSSVQSTSSMDNNNTFNAISDQVKFAILAQQLKCRTSKTMNNSYFDSLAQQQQMHEDIEMENEKDDCDDPKLLIDEEDDDDDDDDDGDHDQDASEPTDLSRKQKTERKSAFGRDNAVAKKIAKNILLQAMNTESTNVAIAPVQHKSTAQLTPMSLQTKNFNVKSSPNFRNDIASKYLKDSESNENRAQATSMFKEEGDLVSVSKLVDNATNSMSFGSFFHPDCQANEHSDEEGLVASGSASESNNSGTEDVNPNVSDGKKKSAYSLAPNRVSCPYCQRMFPWSSSLRRHILTHTGQKPFKCSQCPLLFTTKSNCDRHLLRKHGDVDSAVSLYVPIDDIPEPIKKPTPEPPVQPPPPPPPPAPPATAVAILSHQSSLPQVQLNIPQLKNELPTYSANSDLPFKCHLCDGSFQDRFSCLEHIKTYHSQEFALLLSKGAIEPEEDSQTVSAEDEEKQTESGSRGKYPDYANRKVICAFCVRRFWSTEDLRRHMRTHSGERPFQCDICMRKFTLKHSMLRHQKKHTHNTNSHQPHSASDLSDDEQMSNTPTLISLNNRVEKGVSSMHTDATIKPQNLSELIARKFFMDKVRSERKASIDIDRKLATHDGGQHHHHHHHHQQPDNEETSELIGNLLGISDSSILNKVLLSSADEAAKLLGVEK